VTKDGSVLPVRCGNWFGLEGKHEESGPAPMELYIGNMFYAKSNRTIESNMKEIKGMGINTIRLPIAPQTLDPNDPMGRRDAGFHKNNPDLYPYATARDAMLGFLKIARDHDMNVMIDIHSCSNYVGWRAGRLDATPPYVDKDRGSDYKFRRENYSCGPAGSAQNVHTYNEAKWLEDIREIATIAKSYKNVIGIDIFNEPWEYTWDEWATLSEKAYAAMSAINDDILIFVQGISGGNATNEIEPHGSLDANPNWGENFYGFTNRPLKIPQDKLVTNKGSLWNLVVPQHVSIMTRCTVNMRLKPSVI